MRICSGPGCLAAIPDDVKFCEECKPSADGNGNGIRSHSNADRDTYAELYGGRRWKNGVQPRAMHRDPFCKRCETALSQLVDHIVPASVAIAQAKASGRYPYDPHAGFYLMSNLQGLCRSCHKTKTDEDKAHQGEWPDVIAKENAAPKKKWSF
jgi:5-methylcytosine-specific restriction endonuclease McrA